jgi:hypothetical protein
MTGAPSKTTQAITVRIPNEELAVIDLLVEMGGYESRGACLRSFIKPAFVMCSTAVETKSIIKATKARIGAEKELMGHINAMIKATEVQLNLFDEEEAQPA